MKSFRFNYKGTSYITHNVPFSDPEVEQKASTEYKNATSYSTIILSGLTSAWNAELDGETVTSLSEVTDVSVEELPDGYLKITGQHEFAPIEITPDKIVRNGEVIWEKSDEVDTPVVAPEVIDTPIVEIDTPVKEPESVTIDVHEAAPVTENSGLLPTSGVFTIGAMPGKNGKPFHVEHKDVVRGLTKVDVPNVQRRTLDVGNTHWKKTTSTSEDMSSQVTQDQAKSLREMKSSPHVGKKGLSREKAVTQSATTSMPPIESTEPCTDSTTDKNSRTFDARPELPVAELLESATSVEYTPYTHHMFTDKTDGIPASQFMDTYIPDSEVEEYDLPQQNVPDVNNLGEEQTAPVTGDVYPDFLKEVPHSLLEALTSFTVTDIPDSAISLDYVIDNCWIKAGSWYAIDIVPTSERLFFESGTNKIYRTSYKLCVDYKNKLHGESNG